MTPDEQEKEAKRLIADSAFKKVDLAVDPLFEVALLKFAEDDHILFVTIDHLIFDLVSICILRRDIWELYRQGADGEPLSLPRISIQFADFAVWQAKTSASWKKSRDAYWRERLAGAQGIQLFAREEDAKVAVSKWDYRKIRFDDDLISRLRALSRRERTSLPIALLTAYAALLLRWCNQSDIVIPFITQARPARGVENTVGFFGVSLFLRVELLERDTLIDLLRSTIAEYTTAFRNHDFGRIAAQTPRQKFVMNPVFNWFPEEYDMMSEISVRTIDPQHSLTIKAFSLDDLRAPDDFEIDSDHQPGLGVSETKDGITGHIGYRADRVTQRTVERFEKNIVNFAKALAINPYKKVSDIVLAE